VASFLGRHGSRGANACFEQRAGRRVVVVVGWAITTSLAPSLAPAARNTRTTRGRKAAEGKAPERRPLRAARRAR